MRWSMVYMMLLLKKQIACNVPIAVKRADEENDFVLKQTPCAFLDDENRCFIYEARPAACREYPHTNRKNVVKVLDLTLENSQICPAVFEIYKGLTQVYPKAKL